MNIAQPEQDFELDPSATLDIEQILQAAQLAAQEGLLPEDVLGDQELSTYVNWLAESGTQMATPEHYDNLVDYLDSVVLGTLATDIINSVKWDENSRADWSAREAQGIKLLGVADKPLNKALFDGSSQLVHPLLAESVVDFHSRIMAEIWPPEGPVKSVVLGESTPDKEAQADRVSTYMNYQYTELMPGAFEEEDALLFRLPLSGSVFKKTYFDPLLGTIVSRMIEPADFIVPYSATDLASAPRFTHRFREMHNTVLKKVTIGYYSKNAFITEPRYENADYPEVLSEIDATEGKAPTGVGQDARHTLYECYIDLDLPGFEDTDETGAKTGIARPYIVTVNRDDQSIMRIQRDWEPEDEKKARDLCVTHYRFMPGLGFYGYGLLHLIGSLALSASGSLNALLDSAAFANLQAGYRTRFGRLKGTQKPLAPGEFREVDCSAEDLSKAFYRLPYEEPSDVLFNLLVYLDEKASKFLNPGEVMTGEANNNAPVGTTLALIEQGSKRQSAVHRRIHNAHKVEFRILAKLNARYVPEEGYPYASGSLSTIIFAADFDKRVDVIPVADPNIISNTQRIHQAQAVLDLAEKHPDQINMTKAIKFMLTAIRIPELDDLMKVDPAIKEMQAQSAQLDIQIKQAELAKTNNEAAKVDAEKTESNLRGIFAAMQAAGLAMDPTLAALADSIFASAGGKDYNGRPLAELHNNAVVVPPQGLAPPVQPHPAEPSDMALTEIQQNTSPGFPAHSPAPELPVPQQPPHATQTASPMAGQNMGIETMRNEGVKTHAANYN